MATAASAGVGGSSSATMASLSDARLADTQSRLSFLWTAAHSPLAITAPAVSALLLRSLRQLAAQEDCTLAVSHTQTAYCPSCCSVRLPGVNCTVRVKDSAEQKRKDKRRKQRKQRRMQQKEQQQRQLAHTTDELTKDATAITEDSGASMTDTDTAATVDVVAVTPTRKRRRDSSVGRSATPFKLAAPVTPAAARSANAAALGSTAPSSSAHALVFRCLTCGSRDRLPGCSTKQRRLLSVAPTALHSLQGHTAAARNDAESAKQAALAEAEAERTARESAAKRAKLLHSLQSAQSAALPAAGKAPRTTGASLQQLALAQQRLAAAAAEARSGAEAPQRIAQLAAATPHGSSFFSEQISNAIAPVVRPTQPIAATAPASSAAPFTFSRSAAPAAAAGVKKPSLAELLRGSVPAAPSAHTAVTSTALHMQMHVHTPMQAQTAPAAATGAPPSAGKKKGGGANVVTAAAAASTSVQGIAIFGGIKPTAAAASSAGPSAPFSFSKQSGKATPQPPSRKSR